jgi:hypothetical protein
MGKNLSKDDKKVIGNAIDSCWEVKLDTVNTCGKAPTSVDVFISALAKVKIDRMMELFSDIEWLAYLWGIDNKVLDIIVPKQSVSSGSVTNIDTSVCSAGGIIGVIHSHHSMGNSFSKTDDDWINQNNDISLCISNNGINGQMRWKTPCGSLFNVKVNVRTLIDFKFDVDEFDKTVKECVNKRVCVVVSSKLNKGKWAYNDKTKRRKWFDDDDDDDDDDDFDDKMKMWLKKGDSDEPDLLSFSDNESTLEEELLFMEGSGMFGDNLE